MKNDNDKIYKRLPEYHQTIANRNLFEVTVEQLFSQANVETLKGLIGTQRSNDYNVTGSFVREGTATRHHYSLAPVVNTINNTTGASDNFVFFDEFISTLDTYSVDVTNQNRLFGSKYQVFMPPIDVDKLINFQEYYWVTNPPTAIQISGTLSDPIDIDNDIIGHVSFTPPGGKSFKNGMVVRFTGEYVIPIAKAEVDWIIQGVGESIILVPVIQNYSSPYSIPELGAWDATTFSVLDANIVHTAGNITSVVINNGGVGYISPTVTFVGANTTPAVATANANITTGEIEDVTLVTGGYEYAAPTGIRLDDISIAHTIDVVNTVVDGNGTPVSNIIVSVDVLRLTSVANVLIGQQVSHANFTSRVQSISGTNVTLTESIAIDSNIDSAVSFAGIDFVATIRTDMATFVTLGNGQVTISGVSSAAFAGVDPNTGDYYLRGGEFSWDKDIDNDGTGDLTWGGSVLQSRLDYLTVARGAENKNVWSRVNFWFHRDNFLDAGDSLPDREFRADRPIIEFDRRLEMFNAGTTNAGSVNLASLDLQWNDVNGQAASTLIDSASLPPGLTVIFPNEIPEIAQYVYKVRLESISNNIILDRVGDPETNPTGFEDGDTGFIPFVFSDGDQILVTGGLSGVGREYYWIDDVGLMAAQAKLDINQAPLFNLYDDNLQDLSNSIIFPETEFQGNKIFGFAAGTGNDDPIYGFPLSYAPFKSASEIKYENFIDTERATYSVFGETEQSQVNGYYYYKLLADTPEYHSYWKNSTSLNEQTIDTLYYLDRFDISSQRIKYYIGCVPNVDLLNPSGYDINILVNSVLRTDFNYVGDGFVDFDEFNFSLNDVIEIKSRSSTGLLRKNSISKYELPMSWFSNVFNEEITSISEPEYLEHFKNYMSLQQGFSGDPLGSNTFTNTSKKSQYADQIVRTDQDLILGAFLADDQPHNIINALRFNASEYEKYKNRLRKEITAYYSTTVVDGLSTEQILEDVLRRLIAFSVGKEVFNRTYIIPYGDNFSKETFSVIGDNRTFTLTSYQDLDKIENSLLVYHVRDGVQTLLVIDLDYTISNFNPITLSIAEEFQIFAGDQIIAKLYDDQRDSAQCPPTPSTMGLYPLYQPGIITDATFQTPVDVLIGHDGSRTTLFGDIRDDIMLEFEVRIYNAAKAEFRLANSIPELSLLNVRSGAFRTTNFNTSEWFDLLRTSFSNWAIKNKVDAVINEHYDEDNKFTWNYRGLSNLPGYWRGWYTYYYDTVSPNTSPWEMLGFFERPIWWEIRYGTDYSALNTSMWEDLEAGIIRQGPRENVTGNRYLTNNPFRRVGLHSVLPVDEAGNLRSPYMITTTGSTTITEMWSNLTANVSAGFKVTSFLNTDGLNIDFDTANVYVRSDGLVNHDIESETNSLGENLLRIQELTYNIPRVTLSAVPSNPTIMPETAIAVMVNGIPLFNINQENSWNGGNDWHYDSARNDVTADPGNVTDGGLFYYYVPTPETIGLDAWGTDTHSPVIGWAFDGLPIYGPYGYSDYHANGQVQDNTITNIKSSFELKSSMRDAITGPGGAHTGVFIEDYTYSAGLAASPAHAGKYNQRYGVTPDSPSTPIRFYVTTIDDSGEPMFPYAVGGGTTITNTYAGKYYALPQDSTNNSIHAGYISDNAIAALTSESSISQTATDDISDTWEFGDGAPVETAWRYSEIFPFAVAEALFLAKPGKFATVFADPTQLIYTAADPTLLLDKNTRRAWHFADPDHFKIHGDFDGNNNFITNIGYTPFIHTWLQFQGFNTVTSFVDKLRSVNSRLGYRFAGFIDKDTMTVRTDQYSTTGNASSLIIPKENIEVVVHTSPYKTRNFYTGAIIEKTSTGYKVRGFDKNFTYFNVTESKTNGRRQEIEHGGKPASFVLWKTNTTFAAGTIVKLGQIFYQNAETVQTGTSFDKTQWSRLSSLPQVGGAKGVFYQETTGNSKRVDYETEFTTVQGVFDFLINLGRFQQEQGYAFGEFDTTINSVRNWLYSAEQFLFWTTGKWEIGNTLELSPMATKIRFDSPRGFVGKISRTDRNQFTLLDQDGSAISITDCEILRENTSIEIVPPTGKQIYGCLLYTIEIEHAMVLDNVTDFNDTMFNSLLNQKQTRLHIKTKRTAGWDGRFSSSGFIIQGDELRPNLDNQAESLGRYYELGFIPVEKDVYTSSRALFGYQDRSYLRDLGIVDDDQFEFYKGMIQNKGTIESLSRIAKSSAVIQGNVTIFDEWALKVGEFGDVENDQSVELRLEKVDLVQDPQLVTLAFPEDTTGVVEKIDVLYNKHSYFSIPSIEISAPASASGIQATAVAKLNSQGLLTEINVVEPGTGYISGSVGLTVIAGNTVVQDITSTFNEVNAFSSALFSDANIIAIANITIADHFAANVSSQLIDLSGATTATSVAVAINANPITGANVVAAAIASFDANSNTTSHVLQITGYDFTLGGAGLANLNLTAGRYQPIQRYAIDVANNTTAANIIVSVDGINVPYSGGTNWVYDAGDRWKIITSSTRIPNTSATIVLNTGLANGSSAFASENIVSLDGTQPYVRVFVNGIKIENPGFEVRYRTPTTTTVVFDNISLLPQAALTPRINSTSGLLEYVLAAGANVFIIEEATIDFTDAYQGDLPGSTLNVKVTTNDGIAIKVGSRRIYDITPDIKNDEVILIDIDDITRFLKKPSGVREHNLWPTTSSIDFTGMTDPSYQYIPNAGYVTPSTVDYRAFDITSVPALFKANKLQFPSQDDLVHIAKSEHNDWNVYQLKDIGANVSFIEQSDGIETAYLYSDRTLFDFIDSNQIHETDLGRYLDYHLVLKKTSASENLVVWTNEQVINKKSARVKDFGAITMIQANVSTAGPAATSIYPITNIVPATSISSSGTANASVGSVTTVTFNTGSLINGEIVRFRTTDYKEYTFAANITHNSKGNITVDSANVDFVKAGRPVSLSFTGDSENVTAHLYYPSNINHAGGTFDIVTTDIIDFENFFGNTTISNITNIFYTTVYQSNLHGQTHTVSNVDAATSSFTVSQSNVTAAVDSANLIIEFQQLCAITSNAHGLYTGDIIKVFANNTTGFYMVESATDNTITINAPYRTGQSTTGQFLTRGVEIVTSEPHGLDTAYAGKRVAIHNANNPYYNQVYRVSSVTSANTVLAIEHFAYTTSANNISDAVMTTLDHDTIKLNNTTIKIDNINSAAGIESSINQAMTLRRAFVSSDQMSLDMVMLSSIRDEFGGTKNQVAGAIPYVTSFTESQLQNMVITGSIQISAPVAQNVGFNKNSITIDNQIIDTRQDFGSSPLSPLNTGPFNRALPGTSISGTGLNASMGPSRPVIDIPTIAPVAPNAQSPTDTNPVMNQNHQSPVMNPSIVMSAPITPCGPQSPQVCKVPLPPESKRAEITPGICYGQDTDIVAGITGNGAGSRAWLGDSSGYYQQTTDFDRDVSVIGAYHYNHGLKPRGLVGAQTWSDNGSTNTFNMTVQFNKIGTFYVHVSGYMRRDYSATTSVTITGATTGNGTVRARWSGQKYVLPAIGNVQEITVVTPGQQVTFSGTTTGGSNHWNSIRVEISAQRYAVTSCGLPSTKNAGAPIALRASSSNAQDSHVYSNQNANYGGQEEFGIHVPAGGRCTLLFEHFSGSNGIEIFQGLTKGAETTFIAESRSPYVRTLDADEKAELRSKFNRQSTAMTDFAAGSAPFSRTTGLTIGVRFAGAMDFVVDSAKGTYIKVIVRKLDEIFTHVLKTPKTNFGISATQDPNPTTPCGTSIHQPNTGNPHTPASGPQTPIITPAGTQTSQLYGGEYGFEEEVRNVQNGRYYSRGVIGDQGRTVFNFGGFGQPAMAGFSFIPDIFKKTVKVTRSETYGVPRALAPGRYINNTVQRVSGGFIMPLASPIKSPIPTTATKIKAIDSKIYPHFSGINLPSSGFLDNTAALYVYSPDKIGTTLRLSDGTIINGALFGGADIGNFGVDGDVFIITDPGTGLPSIVNDGKITTVIQSGPPEVIPAKDAPVDVQNVNYQNENWVFTITGLDENGDPAGPEAPIYVYRPRPGITIDLNEVDVNQGDGLIINGTSVSFNDTSPTAIEHSLKCAGLGGNENGSNFEVTTAGPDKIRISACANVPLTIKEGCRGGVYKEVLDFHIVRGFDQTESVTSNATVVPTTVYGYANVSPVATYTRYSISDASQGTAPQTSTTTTGSILSTKTTSRSTGGNGYVVGERLRLVGGTPIAEATGNISAVCVDFPGSGYSKPENVYIVIGDGTTPGRNAVVSGVTFDANNGIASVTLSRTGDNYDPARPPKIKIIDLGAGKITSTPWVALTAFTLGQIISYQGNYYEVQVDMVTGNNFDTNNLTQKNQLFNPVSAELSLKFDERSVPARVAKFEVLAVDANGTIAALKILDRGIYKVFPSDLTQGIPLEYDGIRPGNEDTALGKLDPLNNDSVLGTPGAYDPARGKFFNISNKIAGGSGARVFLTAREIPDCSEKGNAKRAMGLPDIIPGTNIPEYFATIINTGLTSAGYDPDDLSADYVPINSEIGRTRIKSPGFKGIRIDELTPGLLDKLGIPFGDYNVTSLCIQAIIETSEDDDNRDVAKINELSDSLGLGYSTDGKIEVIQLLCVNTVGNQGPGINGQDFNSIFGDATITFVNDLFQYEIRSISGDPVIAGQLSQECQALYLESQRYDTETGLTLSTFSNVWIDNYTDTGWAYFENGIAKARQSNLVDTNFIKNVILYDEETGNKKYDLDIYDPFKGVLPAYLAKEITFITENDPVVYASARAKFGAKDVGKVWWDTSTIRYNWYEQGTNRDRWLTWGSAFPGSAISLYEWTESKRLPSEYTGTGNPINFSNYIVDRVYNEVTDAYENMYYFWVQNPTKLSSTAVNVLGRTIDTFTLAKNLADPQGYGLNLINFINSDSFTLSNISKILNEDEDILQINFSRNLNPDGLKHTSWLLSRRGSGSNIPEDLNEKLIDSLCGVNSIGDIVPDPLLSEIEKYGNQFRPRQTMFKAVKEARRLMAYALNENFLDLKLNTEFKDWDANLPTTRTYIEVVNWYAVRQIDPVTKEKIRYDASFKPIYNVSNISELNRLGNLDDGTVVQLKANSSDRFQLYIFDAASSSFGLIAIEAETVRLKPSIYRDDTNDVLSLELREILNIFKDNVIRDISLWNELFFDLLQHAFVEQKQLSWAFKTSYLFAEKEESDLIAINGFKPDNFDKVIDYMNEVKPFTSKIRGYKDGKVAPTEIIGENALSDFDKPPYYDFATGEVRILNDFDIDDYNLMTSLLAYNDYTSIANKGAAPFRNITTRMIFDRTNWQLVEFDWNPMVETANASIANNISYLVTTSAADIYANEDVRAIDRIFKADPSVQTQFTNEMELYLTGEGYDSGSGSNVTLTGNAEILFAAIEAGGLNKTLAIAKVSVGGDWKGETWDANVFTRVVPGTDGTTEYQEVFAYDTDGWSTTPWDFEFQVVNYEGTFDETLINFRRDGVIYQGVDGWTFQHMLYGEERPEELALFEPLESLIITVRTEPTAYQHPTDNTSVIYTVFDGVPVANVAANAVAIDFRIHADLFGATDFYRITTDGSANTVLTANLLVFGEMITVADANVLPDPHPGIPGEVWVGTERISYTLKSGNTLRGLERAVNGTSMQDWIIGGAANVAVRVLPATNEYKFTSLLMTDNSNIWLDAGALSLSDQANANVSDASSIMKFLHGL